VAGETDSTEDTDISTNLVILSIIAFIILASLDKSKNLFGLSSDNAENSDSHTPMQFADMILDEIKEKPLPAKKHFAKYFLETGQALLDKLDALETEESEKQE